MRIPRSWTGRHLPGRSRPGEVPRAKPVSRLKTGIAVRHYDQEPAAAYRGGVVVAPEGRRMLRLEAQLEVGGETIDVRSGDVISGGRRPGPPLP